MQPSCHREDSHAIATGLLGRHAPDNRALEQDLCLPTALWGRSMGAPCRRIRADQRRQRSERRHRPGREPSAGRAPPLRNSPPPAAARSGCCPRRHRTSAACARPVLSVAPQFELFIYLQGHLTNPRLLCILRSLECYYDASKTKGTSELDFSGLDISPYMQMTHQHRHASAMLSCSEAMLQQCRCFPDQPLCIAGHSIGCHRRLIT